MEHQYLSDICSSETSDYEYIIHSAPYEQLKLEISKLVLPSYLRETSGATDSSKCFNTAQGPIIFGDGSCNIDKYKLPQKPATYSCLEKYAIDHPPHVFWRGNYFNSEKLLPVEEENGNNIISQTDIATPANIILDKYKIPTSILSKAVSHLVQISEKFHGAEHQHQDYDDNKIKSASNSESSSIHSFGCKSRGCVLDLTEKYAFKQSDLDEYEIASDVTHSASGGPVIYSPVVSNVKLECAANNSNEKPKKRVTFKLPHTVFGEEPKHKPKPKPEEEPHHPHKLPCPHTGCTRLVSIKAGRLTAHFRHHHHSISHRYIIRKREEYFLLDVPKQLFNCNCFCIITMQFIENLPEFTLFLMLTRFNELVEYKERCRVLIWVLADEQVIPINITIAYEDEVVECRVRTLEDRPDLANCLNLSRKSVKKFNRNNGGCVSVKVL